MKKLLFFASFFSYFHLQPCKQYCHKNHQEGFKTLALIRGHEIIISVVILYVTHLYIHLIYEKKAQYTLQKQKITKTMNYFDLVK
jgi:hypothetical protein